VRENNDFHRFDVISLSLNRKKSFLVLLQVSICFSPFDLDPGRGSFSSMFTECDAPDLELGFHAPELFLQCSPCPVKPM
jgi:hypothetical protein